MNYGFNTKRYLCVCVCACAHRQCFWFVLQFFSFHVYTFLCFHQLEINSIFFHLCFIFHLNIISNIQNRFRKITKKPCWTLAFVFLHTNNLKSVVLSFSSTHVGAVRFKWCYLFSLLICVYFLKDIWRPFALGSQNYSGLLQVSSCVLFKLKKYIKI